MLRDQLCLVFRRLQLMNALLLAIWAIYQDLWGIIKLIARLWSPKKILFEDDRS